MAVYGYNSTIPNSLGLNHVLFEEVFRQASAYPLPTLIAGDFNFQLDGDSLATCIDYGFPRCGRLFPFHAG